MNNADWPVKPDANPFVNWKLAVIFERFPQVRRRHVKCTLLPDDMSGKGPVACTAFAEGRSILCPYLGDLARCQPIAGYRFGAGAIAEQAGGSRYEDRGNLYRFAQGCAGHHHQDTGDRDRDRPTAPCRAPPDAAANLHCTSPVRECVVQTGPRLLRLPDGFGRSARDDWRPDHVRLRHSQRAKPLEDCVAARCQLQAK